MLSLSHIETIGIGYNIYGSCRSIFTRTIPIMQCEGLLRCCVCSMTQLVILLIFVKSLSSSDVHEVKINLSINKSINQY